MFTFSPWGQTPSFTPLQTKDNTFKSLDGKQNCSKLNGSNMPINLHKICQFHFDLSLSFLSMPVVQIIYHSSGNTFPCHFVAPAGTHISIWLHLLLDQLLISISNLECDENSIRLMLPNCCTQ